MISDHQGNVSHQGRLSVTRPLRAPRTRLNGRPPSPLPRSNARRQTLSVHPVARRARWAPSSRRRGVAIGVLKTVGGRNPWVPASSLTRSPSGGHGIPPPKGQPAASAIQLVTASALSAIQPVASSATWA